MASIIKANELQDFGGNSIITSDGAGNVTVNAAAMKNTPAFEAYVLANNTDITDNTFVKVQFDTEAFDTDNCYDNTTNYRFTPTVAGKYYVYSRVQVDTDTANNFNQGFVQIYKNGSTAATLQLKMNGNGENLYMVISNTIDMNGSSDYLEIFVLCDDTSGSPKYRGASYPFTCFGAYRIIGA